MRIIKEAFLKAAAIDHPRAATALTVWIALVRAAQWQNPVALKHTFPDVDPIRVKSKNTVYVFNVRRNEFRIVAAVHFNRHRVYTLRFMTHAEYERQNWKEEL